MVDSDWVEINCPQTRIELKSDCHRNSFIIVNYYSLGRESA